MDPWIPGFHFLSWSVLTRWGGGCTPPPCMMRKSWGGVRVWGLLISIGSRIFCALGFPDSRRLSYPSPISLLFSSIPKFFRFFFRISKIVVSGPLVVIFGLSTSNCSFSTKNQPIWLDFCKFLQIFGPRLSFLSLRNQNLCSHTRLSFLIVEFLNAVRGGVLFL